MDVFALALRLKEEGAAVVKTAIDKMRREMKQAEKDAKGLSKATGDLSGQLKTLGASLVAGLGVNALMNTLDTYAQVQNQLKLATTNATEFAAAQARVAEIAQTTRQPIAAVAELYGKTARASAALGLSQTDVAKMTETVGKSLIVSGTSAGAAEGALTQLAQALASGKVQAEEFNSVQAGAPALIQAVERDLGLLPNQLKKLAIEGKLSSDVFAKAILNNTSVAREFATMAPTMAQQMVKLGNAFTLLAGQIDKTYGISATFNQAVETVIQNLPKLMQIVGTATAMWVSYRLAVAGAAAVTALFASAETIAAFLSLARAVRSLADAGALLSLATGGWIKAGITLATLGAGALAYKYAADLMTNATKSNTDALGEYKYTAEGTHAVLQKTVKAMQTVGASMPRVPRLSAPNMAALTRTAAVLPPATPIAPSAVTVAPGVIAQIKAQMDAIEKETNERAQALRQTLGYSIAEGLTTTLADAIGKAFETALATGKISEGFKAFGRTMLSGLGSMIQAFGTKSLLASALMQKLLSSFATLNPVAAVAASIGLIALGGVLKGAAASAFGGASAGGGMVAVGGFAAPTTGGVRLPGVTFGPTSAGMTGQMTAAAPVNVTIIGPNDPSAQRQMQELISNAQRRGNV